jgi:hypothetical protein
MITYNLFTPGRGMGVALITFVFAVLLFAGGNLYYQKVVFDNSITSDTYYYTGENSSEPSRVTLRNGKLPVESKVFHTPPNALRLEWRSAKGGASDAAIRIVPFRSGKVDFKGDSLFFWCWSETGIAASALPRVQLTGLLQEVLISSESVQLRTGLLPSTWD